MPSRGGATPNSKCHFKVPYIFFYFPYHVRLWLWLLLVVMVCHVFFLWFVFYHVSLRTVMFGCAIAHEQNRPRGGAKLFCNIGFLPFLEVVDINLVNRSFEFTETFAVPKTFFPLK